jgi:ubiquinone/menaquinone biosynthesis C-methylase UbiE
VSNETRVAFSKSASVDEQAPEFVTHMDVMRSWPLMPLQKQRSIEELRLSPGAWALDVGCGTGEDVMALAAAVGGSGKAIGIDSSVEMLHRAASRAAGGPLEFTKGDVYALPFPADTFHGSRCERVFEHLDGPSAALAELVRVTKPGGRVVVISTDADGYMFELPDSAVARKLIHRDCDRRANGRAGRQLYRLFNEAELVDVTCVVFSHVITDVNLIVSYLETQLSLSDREGEITDDERSVVQAALMEVRRSGVGIFCTPHFMAAGTKRDRAI